MVSELLKTAPVVVQASMPTEEGAAKLSAYPSTPTPPPTATTTTSENGDVDVMTNIVECPPHLVGLLIGRKGWTIKKIQQETGAQVGGGGEMCTNLLLLLLPSSTTRSTTRTTTTTTTTITTAAAATTSIFKVYSMR